MYYKKIDKNNCREIILGERLVTADRERFITILDSFIKSENKALILNFKDMHYMDSAGLGFLLLARQAVHDAKKKLVLKLVKHHVKSMFNVLNFDKIFTIKS